MQLLIHTDKRTMIAFGAFSCLLSLSLVVGRRAILGADSLMAFTLWDIPRFFLYGLVCLAACLIFYRFTMRHQLPATQDNAIDKRYWLICSAVLLVCWFIYYLFYLPSPLATDSLVQIAQATHDNPLSNHHPIAHTLLIAIFVNTSRLLTGTITCGVIAYSMAQMATMALISGYMLAFLKKERASRLIRILLLGFLAVNPVVACYSFTVWKDILFAGTLVLLTIQLYKLVKDPDGLIESPLCLLRFFLILAAVALLRNNGIYIVVVVLVATCIMFRAQIRLLLVPSIATVACYFLLVGPVFSGLGIAPTEFAESANIPIQQIANTAKLGQLTSEQERYLSESLASRERLAELYRSSISDPVKFDAQVIANRHNLEDDKFRFISTWFDIGINNPKRYSDSYLLGTLGYWKIGVTPYNLTQYYYQDRQINIFGENTTTQIRGLIEGAVFAASSKPIVRFLFDTGLLVWLLLFTIVVNVARKRRRLLLVALPLLILWGTLMIATPVANEFRYVYGLYLSLPVLILTVFCSGSQEARKANG
jgi:hypothetical protein